MNSLSTTPLRTVTSYGRRAGSARVRVFDWLDWLRLPAESSTYLDGSSNAPSSLIRTPRRLLAAEVRIRRLPRRIEHQTVLVSRQASPFSNGGVEARLLRRAAHGVYDFDDALMHSPSAGLNAVWSKKRVWARSVAAADVVIAGNDYLAAEAAALNPSVIVVPSCVNPGDYVPKVNFDIAAPPRAVWLGSPSTEADLTLIAAPLLRLHSSAGLRLTVISAGNADLGPLEQMVDRMEWSPSSFAADLGHADFGVMPLDDSPWTRGKCAYKLLQYGATALPMIGSPVGANTEVLRLSDGLAASSADDWVSAMEALLQESPERRALRGAAGLKAVAEGYSFAAWESTWRSALTRG